MLSTSTVKVNQAQLAKLDAVYQSCTNTMSASYRRAYELLDKGKVTAAANEFRSIFAPAVKKLYSETGTTAPKRYTLDAKWSSRVKRLHTLTETAQKCLTDGDRKASRKALASLRKQFYYLHTANRLNLSSDGIYAFKKHVDKIHSKGKLAAGEIVTLRILRVQIAKSTLSGRAKADKTAFSRDFRKWSKEVGNLLAKSPVSSKSIARLKTITDELYRKYGIDLE